MLLIRSLPTLAALLGSSEQPELNFRLFCCFCCPHTTTSCGLLQVITYDVMVMCWPIACMQSGIHLTEPQQGYAKDYLTA